MIGLDEGEKLEKAATPGLWTIASWDSDATRMVGENGEDLLGCYANGRYENPPLILWLRNNAKELIAAARERDRLRDFFRSSARLGADSDEPEGARHLKISATLAEQIANGLLATPQPEAATAEPGKGKL